MLSHVGPQMIKCLPGKISFKLAGGLLVSRVSLWLAFFTGGTGLTINFSGSFIVAVLILIAPINISTCLSKAHHFKKFTLKVTTNYNVSENTVC